MSDQNPQIKIDLTNLNRIDDVKNGNIDVFVTLPDGFSISVLVGTTENLQHLMKKDNVNFLSPPSLFIVVTELTEEIIKEAINSYMEADPSGYWLKLHYFASRISTHVFDELQVQEIEERRKDELYRELYTLSEKIDGLNSNEESDLKSDVNKILRILDSDGLDF